jgi:GNAT superfamily N-acetyltransferase
MAGAAHPDHRRRGLGATTLSDLYRELKDNTTAVDLAALWRDLGVDGDRLHDDAPLAAVRRAILA